MNPVCEKCKHRRTYTSAYDNKHNICNKTKIRWASDEDVVYNLVIWLKICAKLKPDELPYQSVQTDLEFHCPSYNKILLLAKVKML